MPYEIQLLQDEIKKLREAIRTHRDQRGDDRCWMDDCTLYAVLPEAGTVTSGPMPPPDEMLENCKKFIELRYCQGEPYVSPQRRIEELEEFLRVAKDTLLDNIDFHMTGIGRYKILAFQIDRILKSTGAK